MDSFFFHFLRSFSAFRSLPIHFLLSMHIFIFFRFTFLCSFFPLIRNVLFRLSSSGYVILVYYALVISTITMLFQLHSVRIIGTPAKATSLPWRIIPALCLGLSPLLNEHLGISNFIGVAIVFLSSSF